MFNLADGLIIMQRFASMTRRKYARWIFIFGVLTGLFFSGGEGIQLLPFAIAEVNNSKNTSLTLEAKLKSYALSVHNPGSYSPLHNSKFPKDANQFPLGGHLTFDWSSVRANFCLQPKYNREKAKLWHAYVFLSLQSDRAPPTA